MSKALKITLTLVSILVVFPSFAEIKYSDLRELPPLPESYESLDYDQRVDWLLSEINKSKQAIEIYRLKRVLFLERYYAREWLKAAEVCTENKPIREDFEYRELCAISTYPDYQDVIEPLLEIIYDARQFEDFYSATLVLNNLAWRQSQHGDVSSAYANYELALAIAPEDDLELLNTVMMDSATNYIVHGDSNYVRKGIALLERTKQQSQEALDDPLSDLEKTVLKDNIQLTDFNTGIAYALHLYDYQKALIYFERVNKFENPYQVSALSFSAMAAAQLNQLERAKKYIKLANSLQEPDPIVDHYLTCYRQLAARHWDKLEKLSHCTNLPSQTTIEVQLDVFKRLTKLDDSELQLVGLKKLGDLYLNNLESQLKVRGAKAASNTELRRLQRESALKSIVLKQQKELQQERDATHASRMMFFISLFIILVILIILIISQLRQKKKLAEQFEKMSIRDPLTKLGNRRFLQQNIGRELAYINRIRNNDKDAALGVYLFDIDHFKSINDTYGHKAGDEVLVEISQRIAIATRETDLLARWGGEEFIYLARVDNDARVYQLAERVLSSINGKEFIVSDHPPIKVTCTLGVVKYPFIDTDNSELWDRLISLADAALYYGKQKQRNCWVVINNENIHKKEDIDAILQTSLEQAVEKSMISIKTSFD